MKVTSHLYYFIVLMTTGMVCPESKGISCSIPVCPSGSCLFMLIAILSASIVIEDFLESAFLRAVLSSLLKQKISVLTYSALACILRSTASADAFNVGRYAEHNCLLQVFFGKSCRHFWRMLHLHFGEMCISMECVNKSL